MRSPGTRFLRNRLYLGLAPLLVVIIALVVMATGLFVYLSGNVQRIHDEYLEELMITRTIEVSAAHIDSAFLMLSLGFDKTGRELLEENLANIRESTRRMEGRGGNAGSRELARRVDAFVSLISEKSFRETLESGREDWLREVRRARGALSEQIEKVSNHQTARVAELEERISTLLGYAVNVMIVGAAVSLILGGWFSWTMAANIVRPVEEMTRSAQQIAAGNLNQSVQSRGRDELAQLAVAFNKMTAQLRIYHRLMDGRVMRAQRTMRAILESLPHPTFFFTSERHIGYRNESAQQLLDSSEWGGDVPAELREQIDSAVAGEHNRITTSLEESMLFRVGGEERYFLPQIVSIEEDEDVHGTAVILQEVTRMQLADNLKTDLVSTVSHELKTPVTSARTSLYLLLDEAAEPLDGEQRELAETARDELERLLRIIESLLDISRIQAGVSALDLQPVPAQRLLEQGIADMEGPAAEEGIALTLDVAGQLPCVNVDTERMNIVLSNLLSNAIKYSTEGTEVFVRGTHEDGIVRFAVSDAGPGIPEEERVNLFRKFYRGRPGSGSGAGLGLNIAREIVAAHGGSIGVDANERGGSDFYVVIPCDEDGARTIPGDEAAAARPGTRPRARTGDAKTKEAPA